MQKECFKCHKIKDLSEFYRHPQMADGHLNKCKECNKSDVHENYFNNREHYIKYEQERFQDPERKMKLIEYQRNRRSRSPKKYKATNAVNNSKRDGKITVGVCEVCGSHDVEAHHTDYDRPLDVHWLCRKHHLFNHGKLAAQGYSDEIGRIEKSIEQSRNPDDMKRSRYSQGRMF